MKSSECFIQNIVAKSGQFDAASKMAIFPVSIKSLPGVFLEAALPLQ